MAQMAFVEVQLNAEPNVTHRSIVVRWYPISHTTTKTRNISNDVDRTANSCRTIGRQTYPSVTEVISNRHLLGALVVVVVVVFVVVVVVVIVVIVIVVAVVVVVGVVTAVQREAKEKFIPCVVFWMSRDGCLRFKLNAFSMRWKPFPFFSDGTGK